MKFFKDLSKYSTGCFFLIEGLCLFFEVTQGHSMSYYKKVLYDDCAVDDCWEHIEDLNYFMTFLKFSCLLSGFMMVVSVQKGQNFGFALGMLTIASKLYLVNKQIIQRHINIYLLGVFIGSPGGDLFGDFLSGKRAGPDAGISE